jgi:acetoin utilization deacetylase AcuC-like enzyme
MTIVYDERFADSSYSSDNAAAPGRMEAAMSGIGEAAWPRAAPLPATRRQLLLAHEEAYIEAAAKDSKRFAMAALAAGGAILAAGMAMGGESAFACVRPPGHHASRAAGWGYCVFNNLAIALLTLRAEGSIQSALVLDIDQHTGDGTRNILGSWREAEVFNPFAEDSEEYIALVEERLGAASSADIVAVSAGFDAYQLDVGRKLDTADFGKLGALAKAASLRLCAGRRFAVLEGGYYLPDLGANVLAFCRGFA